MSTISLPRAGYHTKEEAIAIVGAADLKVRSLRDREQFHDPRGEAKRLGINSSLWPLFGLAWPSGLKLAARMACRVQTSGERVLEVGCGLALASLVAHRRGANVTASDCHPLAAGFLKANLRLNNLPAMKYRHGQWGEAPDPIGRNGNLRLKIVGSCFDLIIGSDVLYERDDGAALPQFLSRHAREGAEIWIVDPDRANRSAFSRQMNDRGFDVLEERLDSAVTSESPAYKGRLLVYTRR